MAEILTLTIPVTGVTTTDYRIVRLDMNREEQRFFIVAKANTGKVVERLEIGQVALDLMIALNKANLTIKSLERRALEYMASKGDFAGTITGSPD